MTEHGQQSIMGGEDDVEGDPLPPQDRRLVTQSYDMSVATLVEQWKEKTLIVPEVQREYVWDNAKASRLIESLLLNIPIPAIYVAEAPDDRWEVIDGHQRVKSIVRYLNNEFTLSGLRVLTDPAHSRKRFSQLAPAEQRRIKGRVIREVIITEDSHPTMKFEVFERLNTGSVALNAMEIRNSTHRGKFMSLVRKELVNYPAFRKCIGPAKPRKRMVDEELIIRFLAMTENIAEYRPPIPRFLNAFCEQANSLEPSGLDELRLLFMKGIDSVFSIFHQNAFRLTDETGGRSDRSLNAALAETQFVTLVNVPRDLAESRRSALLKEFSVVHQDPDFLDDIRRATSDRTRTVDRHSRYKQAVRRALGERV